MKFAASVLFGVLAVFAYLTLATHSETYSVMPGQKLQLINSDHRRFTIRSQYPISIQGSHCSVARTVQIDLHCDPSNLLFTDLRPAMLVWGQSNQVTVTTPIWEPII